MREFNFHFKKKKKAQAENKLWSILLPLSSQARKKPSGTDGQSCLQTVRFPSCDVMRQCPLSPFSWLCGGCSQPVNLIFSATVTGRAIVHISIGRRSTSSMLRLHISASLLVERRIRSVGVGGCGLERKRLCENIVRRSR